MAGKKLGNGLEQSSKPCQECGSENAVAMYRGTSICVNCLATQGVYLPPVGEGESIVRTIDAMQRKAVATRARLDVEAAQQHKAAVKLEAEKVEAARPQRQIDSQRLIRRQRGTETVSG